MFWKICRVQSNTWPFQRKDKWLVYPLSSAGNPIKTLISKLSKEPFIDNRLHSTTKNSENKLKWQN